MSEEPKIFEPEEKKEVVEGEEDEQEVSIPEDTEFGYIASMSSDGRIHFQTFGELKGQKRAWILSGLHQAVSVIVKSSVEQQINISNTAVLNNLFGAVKGLVSVMKSFSNKIQPAPEKEKQTSVPPTE